MPLPALAIPALIGAGGSILGGAINSMEQRHMNAQQMRFTEYMYNRQRADYLADWNRTNAYNSPEAQMERYKAAGLNPNLIYGQQNMAGSLQTPDVLRPELRAPRSGDAIAAGALTYMNAIYDLDIKAAQADNIRAQNTVIEQDAMLRAVQIMLGRQQHERGQFDFDLDKLYSADARREQVRQTRVSTDLMISRDAREAALNASNLAEAWQRMLNMKEQNLGMQLQRKHTAADIARVREETKRIKEARYMLERDGVIREMDIALRRSNINPNDPMYARILSGIIEHAWRSLFGGSLSEKLFGK